MECEFYNCDSRCAQAQRRWVESPQYMPVTRDTVLAAGRAHDRYLRTVQPREYEMRAFEDGSVFFRNTKIPGLEKLFSLADLQKAARDLFWLDPHRPLWRHILCIWE